MPDPKEALPAIVQTPEPAMLVNVDDLKRGLEARGAMVDAIKSFMGSLLKKDVHFGVIPGTPKPTLYQPGAEDLALAAQAHYEVGSLVETQLGEDHIDVRTTVRLVAKSGAVLGEGVGSCSSKEKKYRYRGGARKCPQCGAEAIINGKPEYSKREGPGFEKGGFLCFAKKGGCGAKFRDDAPEILDQPLGQVENPDVADTWNTVRKMSFKRAMIAAAKAGFGVSSLFTQDLEDTHNGQPEPNQPQSPTTSNQRKESSSRQARASATMPGSSPTRATPAPAASSSVEEERLKIAYSRIEITADQIADATVPSKGETPEQRAERISGILKEVTMKVLGGASIPHGLAEYEKVADALDKRADEFVKGPAADLPF